MSENQPSKASILSLVGFALVVLVVGYLIYSAFDGRYEQATEDARFDFNKPAPPGAQKVVDLHPLLKATPALIAEGKQVYQNNCVPCHGAEGYGNGPRAAGLNPPPRNYHTGVFRFGTSVLAMYHTVTNGSPGTAMPSFVALTPKQRMAVVHFIRQTFIPKNALQHNTEEQLEAIATPASNAPAALPPVQPAPNVQRIPIAVAMQVYLKEAAAAAAANAGNGPAAPSLPADVNLAIGRALYQQRCQQCHGAQGQGHIPTEMIDSNPYVEVTAASFAQPRMLSSINDMAGFDKIVTHGLPGYMMTGQGTLTKAQLDSLYAYVRQLALQGGSR